MHLTRSVGLMSLGLTFATAGHAQDVRDSGILRLYSAGTEIGRETFVRTPDYLQTETVIPVLAVRVTSRASYRGGRLTAYEARVFRLPQDSMLQDYRARVDGDSIRVEHAAQGQTRSSVVDARVDAVAASQSLAAFGDLVRRAAGRDTTFQLWSAEQNAARAVTLRHGGDSVLIETLGGVIIARLGPGGAPAAFDIPSQRVRVERAASLDLPPLAGLTRPAADYSAPPDAPYTAQDVRIPVRPAQGDSFELAGTLTLPKAGRPPFPIAIMITGSGAQDRDENLWPLVPSYRPFRDIAARLAREGIAVLRMDDRGFAPSGGSRDSATIEDFAEDLQAQVAWVRRRPEIDASRIALVGHSEGGVVGPMVAARDPGVAAVVIMAGSAKPGVDVLRDQFTWPIESAQGLSTERKAAMREEALKALYRDTTGLDPWTRHFRRYDPLLTARRVRQPVLILQGALDRQVTAGQADTLAQAMRASGNRDVTVHIFPNLNHLFLVAPTDGSPAEYAAIENTGLPAVVLDPLASWLAARLRAR